MSAHKKVRQYQGNHPDPSEGWVEIGRAVDDDGCRWVVYERQQEHSDDWRTYKVVAETTAARKGNYWYARNTRTGQIGFARDMAMMRANRPRLHAAVERIVAR